MSARHVTAAVFVLLASAVSGAHTFDPIRNLSGTSGESTGAKLAISGANVYVVWEDASTGNGDIYFRRSSDGGQTFASIQNLSSSADYSSSPQVDRSGDYVYVTWCEADAFRGTTYLRVSSNRGRSFGPRQLVASEACVRALVATGQYLYLAWPKKLDDETGDILFRASSSRGASFGEVKDLNAGSDYGTPVLAADGANVFVAWDTGASDELPGIYFVRSTNGGGSFSAPVRLDPTQGDSSQNPHLETDDGSVYIVWEDCSDTWPSTCDVLFRRSTNKGSSWYSTRNLSNNAGLSVQPQVRADGSDVYVAWTDDTPGNQDIFFRRSHDRGSSFSSTSNLSSNSGDSQHPQISRFNEEVHIAWEDATPGAEEIFLRSSYDEGRSFTGIHNLSANAGTSVGPSVLTNNSGIFVVWIDDTPGSFDVLFRVND